jgi:hypothetical protein
MREDQLLFEVLSGDFIQRARCYARSNAQFFCLGKNFFVFQVQLL